MAPTAQEENSDNQQTGQTQQNPIQPGQFVIASEETLANPQVMPTAQVPQDSLSSINQSDIQGPNLSGFTANNAQDPSLQFQGPAQPPPSQPPVQPDPTPFTPPPPIPPPGSPPQQGPAQDSGSNKIKMIGIAAGIISLILIIAALVWFFVLNKQQPQTANTVQPEVVDIPSPQTPTQGEGFGEIPDATDQAQQNPDQPTASQTPVLPDTSQTTIPPAQ